MTIGNHLLIKIIGGKSTNYTAISSSRFTVKGLGSQTGFFGHVICQKVQHNLLSHQLFFMLFEYLCDSNIQKDRLQKE